MAIEPSKSSTVSQTSIQERASSAKTKKGGRWQRFFVIAWISRIKNYLLKSKEQKIAQKSLQEFRIAPHPVESPQAAYRKGITVNRVKQYTDSRRDESLKSLTELAEAVLESGKRHIQRHGSVSQEWLEDTAYAIYADDPAKKSQKLNTHQKFQMRNHLEMLHKRKAGFHVNPQSDDARADNRQRSPGQLSRSQNRHEFAFRFMPTEERPLTTPIQCRLTLSFHAKYATVVSDLLAELAAPDHPFSDIVAQAKILGPSELGNRTDDAVIYLNDNPEKVRLLVRYIHDQLSDDILKDHTPGGMLPLGKGIGYAETHEEDDSSFGRSRGNMIAEACNRVLNNPDLSLGKALAETLQRHGYDPESPGLVLRSS